MQAGVGTESGLQVREVPQPKPKPNEVLVRVRAAGLNRADLNAARAKGIPVTARRARRSAWNGPVR